MCQSCSQDPPPGDAPVSASRRSALGAFAAAALLGLSSISPPVRAKAPPKPGNVLTPEEALKRLMRGNTRYVSGHTQARNFAATRTALAAGQNPYACILSCADSRVGPEFCFDEERGDLFVTRVAGNYVTNDILASLEYGVAVLKAPLIMVLGHSRCGALDAAVKSWERHAEFPGHIQTIVTALLPAVRAAAASRHTGTLLNAATHENVRQNVASLRSATPILRRATQSGTLKVVGGFYDLESGKVSLVA
ncbi:MAG: carbonic anhydrase [Candidimonas sp.]|nr:MAG: carbonic anhydrase [Candidimonas sp.]